MTKQEYAEFLQQARLRRELVFRLRREGKTLQAIATMLNISRQRVHQILKSTLDGQTERA